MPNPFDGGSARLFERLGFECLATSSGASAATLGKRDGQLSREEVLAHIRLVCGATSLPVSADLENGLFAGANGTNTNNTGRNSPFVTGMLKMNSTTYALKDGNANSGGLKTSYNGPLPTTSGYTPLHLEGAIILGIGGDNSNGSAGTFFEGVMTSGFPSDATDNAVQPGLSRGLQWLGPLPGCA